MNAVVATGESLLGLTCSMLPHCQARPVVDTRTSSRPLSTSVMSGGSHDR